MKRLLISSFLLLTVATGALGMPGKDSVFSDQMSKLDGPVLSPGSEIGERGCAADLLRKELHGGGAGSVEEKSHSPQLEAAASLLLPGLGEYRMGHKLRAKVFFGIEGLTWITIGASLWQGYSREGSYKDYAVVYAGVNGTDHCDSYYENLENYMSNEGPGGYNEWVRREARDLYYGDKAQMDGYFEENKIVGDNGWRWESEVAFNKYGVLRSGSESAYRRALYAVMFAMAVRVVSAVDAVRLARKSERAPDSEMSDMSLDIEHMPGGLSLFLRKSF